MAAKLAICRGVAVTSPPTDGDGDDGESVPRLAIGFVVIIGIGNHAATFAGEVEAEFIAKAHGHHVVFPPGHGVLYRPVFAAIAEHAEEVPTEIRVARGADGRHKVDGRCVAVTAHVQTFVVEAVGTGERHLRIDDAFLQTHEGMGDFKCGTGGIGTHDGAIEQGLHGVAAQTQMLFAAVAAYHDARIVGGRRGHAEYFAGFGFDGYNGTEFAGEQPFGQCPRSLCRGRG